MTKLKWGNGETRTGGNPFITDRGVSSHIGAEYNDRQNIKHNPTQDEPYISFQELASRYDTDPQFILNALQRHGVSITDQQDMLGHESTRFIHHMFKGVYKKELQAADRKASLELQKKAKEERAEELARRKRDNAKYTAEVEALHRAMERDLRDIPRPPRPSYDLDD